MDFWDNRLQGLKYEAMRERVGISRNGKEIK
jgi:hypothetical protein